MTNLQEVILAVDHLAPDELERLNQHIQQRRHQGWIVSSENIVKLEQVLQPVHEEASHMTDVEIDAAINQAIAEVRSERQQT